MRNSFLHFSLKILSLRITQHYSPSYSIILILCPLKRTRNKVFSFSQAVPRLSSTLLACWLALPPIPRNLVSLGATRRQVDAKCNLPKTQKRGEPHPAIRMESPSKLQRLLFLFLFFCLLLLLLFFEKLIHIVLRSLIIFHLLPCLAVFSICLFQSGCPPAWQLSCLLC